MLLYADAVYFGSCCILVVSKHLSESASSLECQVVTGDKERQEVI